MKRSRNDDFYGVQPPQTLADDVERCAEDLRLLGYSVIPDILSETQLVGWRDRIDSVYEKQAAEFGEETLTKISELDLCRAPLLDDHEFIKMAMTDRVLTVVRQMLGEKFILNLQNAIINRPTRPHHQSAWHRDLPYQNWVISKPLAIGALFVIDEFSEATGATMILPSSHRNEALPSETWIRNNNVTIKASPGSVILFDAMIFHRAGKNSSTITRRAVNHMYTVPIIKQQYDFPRALGKKFSADPLISYVLGFGSQVPLNASEWRRERLSRPK